MPIPGLVAEKIESEIAVMTMQTRTPIQNVWRSNQSLRLPPLPIRAAAEVNDIYRLGCGGLTARS